MAILTPMVPHRRPPKSISRFGTRSRIAPLLPFLAVVMCGCRGPKVAPPGNPIQTPHPYWIDLQAGWRIRVVKPILKSGGYVVQTSPAQVKRTDPEHAEITLKAGPDYIGYEVV